MTCWAVIPVKASSDSKSRLGSVLTAEQRAALAAAMLERVIVATINAANVAEVCLLGNADLSPPAGVRLLIEKGGGLNAAIAGALPEIAAAGATRVVFIHADLPLVTPQELELLAAAPAEKIAIAPDRHGTGTNALSLPLPHAKGFSFAFGTDSFARHKAEAMRIGLGIEEIHSHGLAKDIDEPDDLPDAEDLL